MAADRIPAGRLPTTASGATAHGDAGRVTAVLGPTNTGKTHFAMDRMLGHASGIVGFPLRLLARENYDRAVRARGKHAVALVTGEEKIVPPGASHFICTVEAMPLNREAAFVAVDEVQLMSDPARGHTYTDRVMNLRGTRETMFIGAETARPILRRLAPEAEVISRARFSKLAYSGPKKITRLPPRSAVVAFTAADVYELAEAMRRRRGGTAVVLGALSPRTRNAQVAMYQEGDVDYLVATDAIGMGLNMDIDHVAFARIAKFDGRLKRRLSPAEIGQIAGRAGRHMNDGTFGVTDGLPPFEPEEIEAVEGHEFPPLRLAYWRNAALDYSSIDALLESLLAPPPNEVLLPAEAADDYRALAALAQDDDIRRLTPGPEQVALLWDVCQIPDFRNLLSDAHIRLVRRIFMGLANQGRVHEDWMAREVERIDRTDGEIGTLVGRISEIRTWTYVSYRSDWVPDAGHWQTRTRDIEDKLSDALHERLTERFVDRRTAVLVKRLREKTDLLGAVRKDGEVLVEGISVGRLDGFRFVPDPSVRGDDARAILAAARRVLGQEVAARVDALAAAPDGEIALEAGEELRWRGARIGRLVKGDHVLRPRATVAAGELLTPDLRQRVEARLVQWLRGRVARTFGILDGPPPDGLGSAGRGLLFQLGEALGCLPRHHLADMIGGLTKPDRRLLRDGGVRLGRESVYMPTLLKAGAARLQAALWATWTGTPPPSLPVAKDGRLPPAIDLPTDALAAAYAACGYRLFRGHAVRADRLERLSGAAWKLAAQSGGAGPKAAAPSTGEAGAGENEAAKNEAVKDEAGKNAAAAHEPTGDQASGGEASARPADMAQAREAGEAPAAEPAAASGETGGASDETAGAAPDAVSTPAVSIPTVSDPTVSDPAAAIPAVPASAVHHVATPAVEAATDPAGQGGPSPETAGGSEAGADAAAAQARGLGRRARSKNARSKNVPTPDAATQGESRAGGGGFAATPALLAEVGGSEAALRAVLNAIGYHWQDDATGGAFHRKRRRHGGKPGAGNAAGKRSRRRAGAGNGTNNRAGKGGKHQTNALTGSQAGGQTGGQNGGPGGRPSPQAGAGGATGDANANGGKPNGGKTQDGKTQNGKANGGDVKGDGPKQAAGGPKGPKGKRGRKGGNGGNGKNGGGNRPARPGRREEDPNPCSPFAILKELTAGWSAK